MHIQLARIALDKAKNKDVRQFAQRMLTDHSRLQDQWTALAARNGLPSRLGMGPKHREKVEQLEKVSEKNFDKAYMILMIQQHQQVSYWQNEGRNSKSAQVRRLVNDGLPTEEQHLAQAKKIAREVGVNPAEAVRVAREQNKNNDKDKNRD
jgi:putative membrane protein